MNIIYISFHLLLFTHIEEKREIESRWKKKDADVLTPNTRLWTRPPRKSERTARRNGAHAGQTSISRDWKWRTSVVNWIAFNADVWLTHPVPHLKHLLRELFVRFFIYSFIGISTFKKENEWTGIDEEFGDGGSVCPICWLIDWLIDWLIGSLDSKRGSIMFGR